MDRKEMKRILDVTLEIIYLLTGEEYTLVKKSATPIIHLQESGGWSLITAPPPHSLIQKILELTNKMAEMLTGEVGLRCQDVVEDWDEDHRQLYKDATMEHHQPLTSQDGARRRNPPERCPLYSQHCPEEDVHENHQGENLMDIKVEVKEEEKTDIRAGQQYGFMERNPPERCPLYSQDCPEEDVPENHQGEDLTIIKVEIEEERMSDEDIPIENPSKNYSVNYKVKDGAIVPHSSGESLSAINAHPGPHSTDLSSNPPNHEEPSPDRSQIVTTSEGQNGGNKFHHYECEKPENRKAPTGVKPYSCSVCSKCFTYKSHLVTHERIHTREKPYSCSVCSKCFASKSHLVIHERSHTGEKPYSCSDCGKCFTANSNLVRHKRSHTGEKQYSCSECGKEFTNKSNFIMHEKIHTGERPYACSECGKCFIKKVHLIKHERSHTGVKPYSCSECGKCFTDKSSLVAHKRSHTGEKPYSCSECGKCFLNKSDLVRHKRSHTGEKPFSCLECGKRFITTTQLGKHHRIHTGEKPFKCSVCGKCFRDKSHLVTHGRIHIGEKPFSC